LLKSASPFHRRAPSDEGVAVTSGRRGVAATQFAPVAARRTDANIFVRKKIPTKSGLDLQRRLQPVQ
jgi:hypothetical protein